MSVKWGQSYSTFRGRNQANLMRPALGNLVFDHFLPLATPQTLSGQLQSTLPDSKHVEEGRKPGIFKIPHL